MSEATNPLRKWEPFLDFMQALRNPILGALTGALFTALVQSSSATTGIVIVFASQGMIPLQAGIAIILGANVGTCVTAMLATIGKPRTATQVALVHLIFNTTGVIVALIVMAPFAQFVRSISPEGDTARQVANAHTVFNIANAVLFIGFTGPLAKLVQRIAPLKPAPPRVQPKYLEKALLDVPAGALDAVRREIGHLGEQIVAIVRMIPTIMAARSPHEVEVLARMDEDADTLHAAIVAYLGQVATRDIAAKHAARIQDFIEIANDLDHASDTIEKEMATELREQLARRIPTVPTGPKMKELIDHTTWMIEASVEGVTTQRAELAQQVIDAKAAAQDLVRDARNELTRELRTADARMIQSVRHGFDYVGHLYYLTYLARRVAKASVRKQRDEETERRRDEVPRQ